MKTEADKLRNSIQYGLGVMDSGSGEFKELSNKIDELFELSYLEVQSSPNIKQLEWIEDYGYIKAETPFFKYMVVIIGEKAGLCFYGNDEVLIFRTVVKAKSAAQADFEKRVMECLNL